MHFGPPASRPFPIQLLVTANQLQALGAGVKSATFGPSGAAPPGSRFVCADVGEQFSAFSFAGGVSCTATATCSDGRTATGTITSPTSTFPMQLTGGSLFPGAPCDSRTISLTLATVAVPTPASVAGTVDLTTIDCTQFQSTAFTFALGANTWNVMFDPFVAAPADVVNEINATRSMEGNHLFTSVASAALNASNELTITSVATGASVSFTTTAGVPMDALALAGITAGPATGTAGIASDLNTVIGTSAQIGAALVVQ